MAWPGSVRGRFIGSNTHLKELSIAIDHEPFSLLGWRFFRELALNRSIVKLDLYCDFSCDEMLLYLIPFFINHQAFESLYITYLNTPTANVGRLDTLEYALE